MKMLNEGYYNSLSDVECYKGKSSQTQRYTDESGLCNFSENTQMRGLNLKSRNMLDSNIIWNLGNCNISEANKFDITNNVYYCERKIVNSNIWKGNIALMYPSDYGYATSGESIVSRNNCLAKDLSSWSSDCYNNDWLYTSNIYQWTLTSNTNTSYDNVFNIKPDGRSAHDSTDYIMSVRPVLFLNSSVKITSGNGSQQNPYNLIQVFQ